MSVLARRWQSIMVRQVLGFELEPVPRSKIANLKSYRYQGVDHSLVSKYVLNPYWNWLVTLFPLWLAPNMITLIGLLFIASALVLNLYYLANMSPTEDLPPLLYWYTACCMFVYQSFDAIDGKQARRTGSGSPLGQLFDHGCDALNLVMQSYFLPILFRVQSATLSMAVTFICTGGKAFSYLLLTPSSIVALFAFFVASWEEYHTHVLYLGYFSGPVDGQLLAIIILFSAPLFGSRRFMDTKPLTYFGTDIRFGDLTAVVIIIGAMGAILGSLFNVHRSQGGLRNLTQLAQFALLVSIAATTFFVSTDMHHSFLSRSLFTAVFGLTSAYSIFQVICAHLCRMRLPIWSPTYWTILLVAIWVVPLEYHEHGSMLRDVVPLNWLISVCLFYDLVVYIWLTRRTINQFCAFLDIHCFRLKRKSD